MPSIFAGLPWVVAVGLATLIWTVLWRVLAARAGDTDLGRAMAAIYS